MSMFQLPPESYVPDQFDGLLYSHLSSTKNLPQSSDSDGEEDEDNDLYTQLEICDLDPPVVTVTLTAAKDGLNMKYGHRTRNGGDRNSTEIINPIEKFWTAHMSPAGIVEYVCCDGWYWRGIVQSIVCPSSIGSDLRNPTITLRRI